MPTLAANAAISPYVMADGAVTGGGGGGGAMLADRQHRKYGSGAERTVRLT
jgi:hypothetical protein